MQFPLFEGLKVRFLDLRIDLANRRRRDVAKAEDLSLLERGLVTGCAAGLSGSLAALVTTPVDVVKTRIMLAAAATTTTTTTTTPGSGSSSSEGSASTSTLAAGDKGKHAKIEDPGKIASKGGFTIAREIWREQGIKGLFRGGLLRSAWTMLGSGLYLSMYESGRQYLEDRRKGKKE